VPETTAVDVVVAEFDELRSQWHPLACALGIPSAGAARRIAGEAGRGNEPFEVTGQSLAIEIVQCRSKADMVELASVIIEAE